tara:strand:- start:496 stop:636 length:141 start_codon:yes stop_codon:yes gene_type:complete
MVDLSRWMDGSYVIPSSGEYTERTEPMSEEIAAALAKRGMSEDLIH